MKDPIPAFFVDSFTDTPFKGNPAGVCILKNPLQEKHMLSIAMELGLSETAFVQSSSNSHYYSIRYFSPKMEIPLCGHATLASAKVLFQKNPEMNTLHFITVQNLDLKIVKDENGIKMRFPVYKTKPMDAPRRLMDALGLQTLVHSAYNEETNILLLEIADSDILRNLKPDFEALYRSHDSINGVLVTAKSSQQGFDFESRYFWPWSGTHEDPVTGATHTFLAKYWGDRLHKTKMNSFQCSKRTGFMQVELIGEEELIISSTARIVLEGTLDVFKNT